MNKIQQDRARIAAAWKSLWERYPEQFSALEAIQERIGYQFRDVHLLYEALTHRSAIKTPYGRAGGSRHYLPEWEILPWNERIEFLGDSVLNLVISTRLWEFPAEKDSRLYSEGDLSRIRSALVNEEALAALARTMSLQKGILISRGEARQGGRERPALLADALEALFGAVYLDGGFEPARRVITHCFADLLARPLLALERDCKSKLQEWSQKYFQEAPEYRVDSESGPPHARVYEVSVFVKSCFIARAAGCSKKRASQAAAEVAMEKINSKVISADDIAEHSGGSES